MTDAREVRSLVDDRPDLEPALESLLETDDGDGTWTFDDTGLDSGTFGELVSAGVVEKVDGRYRLADPGAVERALAGEVPDEEVAAGSLSLPSVDIDRRVAAALAGALLLVFCARVVAFDAVFRDGRVVLAGNDPYYYLYWTEELSRRAPGLDPGVLTGGSFPADGEPLLIALLWSVTQLLGGAERAPLVLAWYPVVAGVVTAGLIYLLGRSLADDERVGLAAVVMLAAMPVLAFRSGLGFADHHAFDYVWLAMTAAAAVRAVRLPPSSDALRRPRTVGVVAGLGLGVTGQLLAWEAGPLLLVPLALAVPLLALVAVDAGESPLFRLLPLAGGFALAAMLTGLAHLGLGWQSTTVALTPVLLLAGTVGVAGAATAVRHVPDPPLPPVRLLAAVELVGAAVVALLLSSGAVATDRRLRQLGTDASIVEASSVFSSDTFGWLFLFGLLLFLAVPCIGWALFRATRDGPGDRHPWLLAGTYGAVFLALAALQMRFAGELSLFVAVFSGVGFVLLAERIDLARPIASPGTSGAARSDGGDQPPFAIPSAREFGSLLFLFLLVAGLSVAQVPVKANQIALSDSTYESAAWVEQRVEERGTTYPESYVLSDWGRNRVYNYFASGESRSYGYAFRTYERFITSTAFDPWYDRFRGRVGYVVLGDADAPPATLYQRLSRAAGGRYEGEPGSGHFRLVHVAGNRIYEVVPGANVTGTAPANATVELETDLQVGAARFTYTRRTSATATGEFSVRVAYPGEYTVTRPGANGTTTVTVPETAVENGERVEAGTAGGRARLAPPAYQVSPS